MSRPQTVVERVEHLLHDSAPDEIAVLLNISEAEVRRIAQLLDERGPADPKPLPAEDVQAVAVEVEDLPDEPVIYGDDIRRLLHDKPEKADAIARRALLTVAEHSGSRYDVEDLAGMLGLTGALTDWQPSVQGPGNPSGNSWGVPAPQAPMSEPGDATTGEQGPSIPVENHATPQVSEASSPPIDKMRELADDGLEPWQIAAALGVREDAVLVALAAAEAPGGAQRAVEDALSLVPVTSSDPVRNDATEDVAALAREMAETFTAIDEAVDAITPEQVEARLADILGKKSAETRGVDATEAPMSEPGDATTPTKPDTLAPTRPMTKRLADHVAITVCGPDTIDESGGLSGCRCVETAPQTLQEPAAWEQADDCPVHPLADPEPSPVAHYVGLTDPYFDERLVVGEEARTGTTTIGNPVTVQIDVTPGPITVHVHDPFPVADETGVWHAECTCGTRWDRALCDYPECGAPGPTPYVAALHIARTGTSRHAHHPPA